LGFTHLEAITPQRLMAPFKNAGVSSHEIPTTLTINYSKCFSKCLKPPALQYLHQRGLRDPELIHQLGIGYAPGGSLRRYLSRLGYGSELLLQTGLINPQGRDTFWRHVIFPCRQGQHVINLYGRRIDPTLPHRFLPRPRGGLFAWELVRDFSQLILVEGLFDVAVLWQAGLRNSTCAFGTHLTSGQMAQLADNPKRQVFLAFDQDPNGAGPQAARALAQCLERAGLLVRIVSLPPGQDPNSLFVAGATADDFARYLQRAQSA
jgi:DNA primase